MLSEIISMLALGALMGVVGGSAQAISEQAKERNRAKATGLPISSLFDISKFSLTLAVAALSGAIAALAGLAFANSVVPPTAATLMLFFLIGYVSADVLENSVLMRWPRPEFSERSVPMASVKIYYRSELLAYHRVPTCVIMIEDSEQIARIEELGEFTASFPDRVNRSPLGVRILFSVFFDPNTRPVQVLARVWRLEAIHLNAVDRYRMVGTISGERMVGLSANAVEQSCDLACLPPAEQSSGPGRCVVCTLKNGVFELCC
jgi:hypothetical protein